MTLRFHNEATVVMVDDTTFTSCTDRLSMMHLDVHFTGIQTESTDPHRVFNVDQTAFKSLHAIQHVIWRHVIINLAVVLII